VPTGSGISTVAVLGAGTMGRGIAQVAAQAGYSTVLHDVAPAVLADARFAIAAGMDKGVARGKLDPETAAAAKERLRPEGEIAAAVATAGLVIEAAPESMAIKLALFREVTAAAQAGAIFVSNTSGLSITEMAAATDRPDRFAGMHFFNPVPAMRLVELVRGLETSEATLATLSAVGERMGKDVVVVNESPGFVTSRINALIGNEAFRMLEAGVASAQDIDKALRLGLNHPMGPFEMVDLVGLDVRLAILEHLHRTLGETYRPSTLLARYVKAGRLGRKVRRGVYTYAPDGSRLPAVHQKAAIDDV
jgi:3-hydroxybutyryl-CoA dehydrogenase